MSSLSAACPHSQQLLAQRMPGDCRLTITLLPVSLFVLQPTDFDLILGVQPAGYLDYGGRHITIAKITATSREAATAVLKNCNEKLADAKTGTVGWVMKGPPANCLGHMEPGVDVCKDHLPWPLQKE